MRVSISGFSMSNVRLALVTERINVVPPASGVDLGGGGGVRLKDDDIGLRGLEATRTTW